VLKRYYKGRKAQTQNRDRLFPNQNRFREFVALALPKIYQQVDELAKCELFSTPDLKSASHRIPQVSEDRVHNV